MDSPDSKQSYSHNLTQPCEIFIDIMEKSKHWGVFDFMRIWSTNPREWRVGEKASKGER